MKKSRNLTVWFLITALAFFAGCAPETSPAADLEPVSLTVSAAASLTEAFDEIGGLFEDANPQVKVVFNYAGSQQLAQQIAQGARVDVFASANRKQMDFIRAEKALPEDAAAVFAGNRLVIVVPNDNPGNITSAADLARPGLKLVFAGAEVPAGQYSLDFLDLAEQSGSIDPGYKDAVIANVVSYENNVRAVLTKVSLGEADGGIVYATDAARLSGEVKVVEIPAGMNINANYWILALPDAEQSDEAQAFVAFVLSTQGQQVLEKYGFQAVQ